VAASVGRAAAGHRPEPERPHGLGRVRRHRDGRAQFAKETLQTVGPVAAQVYVARTNAHTQEVLGGFQRDTQIATVNGFTAMGGQIQTAGTAGYRFVQAPQPNVTMNVSGAGASAANGGNSSGSQSTTSTTTTTTTTDSHDNPSPVVCIGTPPTCSR
jgi:hypothetical protein